ncbi:MAG: hypothetical protein QM764_12530 [Chitinophagaceae bacterium]
MTLSITVISRKFISCVASIFISLVPVITSAQTTFFISPSGNDAWTGKISDPSTNNSDGTF